jgi:hypothetical protein
MDAIEIPLACCADEIIRGLANATGSTALASLTGTTLLGERAMLGGMTIPDRISAGGGCRLFDARNDVIALNLARSADRELLPALFEVDVIDTNDDRVLAAHIARHEARPLVSRGRSLGLAIAAEHENLISPAIPCVQLAGGCPTTGKRRDRPRVIDLSALWAGPLASHLLWLAGAEVIKVENRTRRDRMREGNPQFHALLNQGKASVALDFAETSDRRALHSLIATADIVIEASRPRALLQLGFDAAEIVRTTPGLVWITITGHGATEAAAGWVGFGDDCGVAAGLSAKLRAVTGSAGFVGDAIADPLTGIFAASAAWDAWTSRRGGRFGLALSRVAAHCLVRCNDRDPEALRKQMLNWRAHVGEPFPPVQRRSIGALPSFGEHTLSLLAQLTTC